MDALTPGTQLGNRYRLVDELGRGGMARVWRAVDEVLGRLVAVKVLAPSLTGDREFLGRFRVEARAAAQLAHAHIAGVFDYGEWELPGGQRVACIVLELLEGESLAARLRRGPLPWAEAVTAAAQVAQALAAAHRRGVVHRDVKPANVVLTPDGAKVLDFGIAAMAGEPERGPAGGVLGTAAYVAPELLAGAAPSPAADVYSLGVLLFESLTGHLPPPAAEAGPGPPGAAPWDATGAVPLGAAGAGAEVAGLLRWCLAGRPDERPSSAWVAEVLGAAAGAGPGAAATGGHLPLQQAASPGDDTTLLLVPLDGGRLEVPWLARTRARPWLVGGAIGAALGLLAVLVAALRPPSPEPAAAPPVTTAAPVTTVTTPPVTTATAAGSIERVRRIIDEGVAAGEIRPDVARDLDNLVDDLRDAIDSEDRGDLQQRVAELQRKLRKRQREGDAITPARAEAISAALGELARSQPST